MRVVSFLVLCGASVFFPWWCIGLAACVYGFFYPQAYELLLIGVAYDVMFGSRATMWSFAYVMTCVMCGVVLLSLSVRPYIRFTERSHT